MPSQHFLALALLLLTPLLRSATTGHAAQRRRVSGWTGFDSCGDVMCSNQSKQLQQLVSHADTIHSVYVYAGAAAPQYNVNHSICYNGSATLPTGAAAFPWAAFRFGAGPGHLGPSEGDGSGRYLCTPTPDTLVTAWAQPLQAAGIEVMPIIDGGATIWPVEGRDDGFFEAAVTIAKKFGFAGWSLDVEPTVTPAGSGAKQLADYAQFLTAFSRHLASHGLKLSTAEPNGNLVNTSVPGSSPWINNFGGYSAVGHSGAEVTTMNTYYGVMPLTVPHLLDNDIKEWQQAVAPEALTIGFGALYAAWGDKSCGPGPAGVNQTGCLQKSLAACEANNVESIAIFEFNAFGCGLMKFPMCQIAGPWPPESWWPLLHSFAVGDHFG